MLVWSVAFFFAVTFLLIGIAVVGAFLVLQNRAMQRQEASIGEMEEGAEAGSALERLLKTDELSSISVWHALLARFDFIDILKRHLAQADLTWSVGRVTLGMLLSGTTVFYLLSRFDFLPLWAAIGIAWMAGLSPYFYVLRRRTNRFHKFREGFPDALDSLSRGLRAGYPLVSALELVASETDAPVSTEIRKTF